MGLRQKITDIHCIFIFLNDFLNTLLLCVLFYFIFTITCFLPLCFARSDCVPVLSRLWRKLFYINLFGITESVKWHYCRWCSITSALEGANKHWFSSRQWTQPYSTNLPDVFLLFSTFMYSVLQCILFHNAH